MLDARVCLVNRGPTPVELAGDRTPVLGSPANLGRQLFGDDVRVVFLRPEEESWWQLAPRVADRFGLNKAPIIGSWTLWGLLALFGVMWMVAFRLVARSLGSP